MAGSYFHAVNQHGQLHNVHNMAQIATETQGDAYETIEELYGMIWFLAVGDPKLVEYARKSYKRGIDEFSPGVEHEGLRYGE